MQMPAGRVIDIAVSTYVQELPGSEAQVIMSLRRAALTRLASDVPAAANGMTVPIATYKFSLLCFKRDVIEALAPRDSFRVETPIGAFR
jgi:hypothetical protein